LLDWIPAWALFFDSDSDFDSAFLHDLTSPKGCPVNLIQFRQFLGDHFSIERF